MRVWAWKVILVWSIKRTIPRKHRPNDSKVTAQLPNLWFLRTNQMAALNYAMPHPTHSMLLPHELPASEIHIFCFVTFLILSYVDLLKNSCLIYLMPSFTLGPRDPDCSPGSVPIEINVIYISIHGPLLSHWFIQQILLCTRVCAKNQECSTEQVEHIPWSSEAQHP